MYKSVIFRFITTTVLLFAWIAASYAQSCLTPCAGTTFQPKSGITDANYKIESVKFTDPSSESLNVGMDFNNGKSPLKQGEYTVTKDGMQMVTAVGGHGFTFFSYSLNDLITITGKNKYKVDIEFEVADIASCTCKSECHRGINFKFSYTDNGSSMNDYKEYPNGTYTWSKTFTAKSPKNNISWSSDHSNDCKLFIVKSITVTGCMEKKIVSENGEKVCAGEDNILTAKGLIAPTYKWEVSTDGQATWTPLAGTESSITVQVSAESFYRCTANGVTLVSKVIRPVVCCSVAGTRAEQLNVDFQSASLRLKKRVNFSDLDDPKSKKITSSYTWSGANPVDENKYNIVNTASDGGYWTGSVIVDHTKGGKEKNNGFLLVNCGAATKNMFEYIVEEGQLCQNTVYDFSAFIANIDSNTATDHEPVNAGFLVYGLNDDNTQGKLLVDTETGDLPYTGKWVEKGESFNSEQYKKFKLIIKNNHEGTPNLQGQIIGNDIGIDDITFSTCTPEIKIYTDPKYITQDTIVCDDEGNPIELTLEAHSVYDLSTFFKQPYYLFQTSMDKVTWKNTSSDASTSPTTKITVKQEEYENGLYYRVWVGGDKTAVENAANGHQSTGCGQLTAVSEPIIIKYHCKCTPTPAPTVNNYSECPVTSVSGTIAINTLVTSDQDLLRVYDSATSTTDLGANFEFDAKTVGTTTYYITNQKPKTNVEYCESERTPVTITIKGPAEFTVSPETLKKCYDDETPDSELTFTASEASYTYTWTGTDISATGISYTLAKAEKSGTIKVTATDPSGAVCDASVEVTYQTVLNPKVEITAPTIVCLTNPEASIEVNVTQGSGHYKLMKNTSTVVEKGDMSLNQTTIYITDKEVAKAVGTINYTFTIENQLGCIVTEEFSIKVGDKIDIPLVPTAPVENNRICLGSTFDINATYTLGTSETLLWKIDGVNVSGVTGSKLEGQAPTADTEYTVELQGGACPGDGSLTIYVDKPAAPDISTDKNIVCAGSAINLTDADTETAEKYIWYKDGVVMTGQSGKDILDYIPTETATYYKESINGACTTKSNEVTVEVRPAIEFTVEPIGKRICVGDEVELKMSGYPAGSTLQWIEKATGTEVSTDATVTVAPAETSVYTAVVTNVCQASKELTITVLPEIDPQISSDVTICEGKSTTLTATGVGATSVTWSPASGLDKSEGESVKASPSKSTTYTATISNGICSEDVEVTVTVATTPRFEYVKTIESETCTTRGVEVAGKNGTPPYLFSDDNKTFTPETQFYGLTSGGSKFYIKDDNSCQSDTTIYLEPYPIIPDKFFTPNEDGINELWQVENLNCYEGYIVEIFDRYGRRLYIYKKGSFSGGTVTEDFEGWDGNYNGHQMPSTDYWYLITVEEIRKQYNGHFLLKR